MGEKGIIPRVCHDIFERIKLKEDWSFKVSVSFMELYQEQLYDLLSDKQRNQSIVDIREDGKSIKIVGVTEKQVANVQETLKCLTQGAMARITGAIAMNAHSSRSHVIFKICIHQKQKNDPNTATVAKFHLVDLAGSERCKKTQATGEQFKEGVNINKGLFALGNVISRLGYRTPSAYIGYRDNRLTRLLQDSLDGNSMTLMIACVSPADYNLDETLSTLRYADRARKIKNKPIVNQDSKMLRQAEVSNNVQNINKELALKKDLASEFLKNAAQQTAESQKNVEREQEVKRLYAEEEEAVPARLLQKFQAELMRQMFTKWELINIT